MRLLALNETAMFTVNVLSVTDSRFPGIDHFNAAGVIVRDVAGRNRRAGGTRDCGDLRVKVGNRPAGPAALRGDAGVGMRFFAAERQNAAAEIVTEHRLGRGFQSVARPDASSAACRLRLDGRS